MPSDSKKKREQKKKDAAKKRTGKPVKNEETENGVNGATANEIDEVTDLLNDVGLDLAAKHRSCTGVLASHPDSRDVHIETLSIAFHGAELLHDTRLELNVGRRYGLIGLNGCGKSTLLKVLETKEVPVPDHVDIFLLRREMAPSEKTAIQAVIDVDAERIKLEREAEILGSRDDPESHERLMDVFEHLDEMDADKAEAKAAFILFGLGFTKDMQYQKVKNFSGGWRMRIALARALYIKPALLLLDEPTNHLDLNACVWLEEELKTYKRILVIISHSQDFLNGVCTNIIHMHLKQLKYYGGNYDSFVQTRMELEENQMKRYKWEQDQISHMKDYIARFGHGSAKLARQAQSKEKTLKKMVDGGLTERVSSDKIQLNHTVLDTKTLAACPGSRLIVRAQTDISKDVLLSFYFPSCDPIPPPVIMVEDVSFKYGPDKPYIYKNLDFGVDLDTRVALVGPNGAGKSTLLKLITGELHPTDGLIRRHSHLKIGRYHQHLQDQLDLEVSALDYMMKCYPEIKDREEMRKIIGRYGLSGLQQTCPIKNLSDGQRCRVIFAWLAWQCPHLLLLDEPTNHLDIETIDSLAEAINDFKGGLLLVSHDFRLISQVTEEIWICEKQTVTKWNKDIFEYKRQLSAKVIKQNEKLRK